MDEDEQDAGEFQPRGAVPFGSEPLEDGLPPSWVGPKPRFGTPPYQDWLKAQSADRKRASLAKAAGRRAADAQKRADVAGVAQSRAAADSAQFCAADPQTVRAGAGQSGGPAQKPPRAQWSRKRKIWVSVAAVLVASVAYGATHPTPKPSPAAGAVATDAAVQSTPAAAPTVASVPVKTIVPTPTPPAAPPPAPSQPLVTDLPQFDQAGSGPGCDMHYSQTASGMTITRFTLAGPGELITHVTGSDYVIHRNDNQVQAGNVAYSYDVPLSGIQDMGAVMYFSDGTSQSCTIGPGTQAP